MCENKRFYIKIDGYPMEVTEEIYRAYKRPAWAERKKREARASHELSLDMMPGGVIGPQLPLDEAVLNAILLSDALASLSEEERALIDALFYEGLTEREYAERAGSSQQNINQRKNRILQKIKKHMAS